MLNHVDVTTLYKTQWKAVFADDLGQPPIIVYGESEEEALDNALGEYRKQQALVDPRPRNRVVKYVKYIG